MITLINDFFITKNKNYVFYTSDKNKNKKAISSLSKLIRNDLYQYVDNLVILCVGTDRSTGDSLGPLTGTLLKKSKKLNEKVKIYGTLKEPIHAINLEETIDYINSKHNNPTIFAIDACLGKSENIGKISFKLGALQPGIGVNKDLPHVGDFHLIGVVNVGGSMEYLVLQNTRLSLVYEMAKIISKAIKKALL